MQITDRDRTEIRSVIERQIQAFQRDDAVSVFSFASPEIQAKFGTPEQFIQMVKIGYPAVYRPRSVIFEDAVVVQGVPSQPVLFLSPNGKPVKAIYLMKLDEKGSWRIDGCYLVSVENKLM
ncbi:DUF4864 domain-containing protein [Limnoraphis robusta Tam1]|uniref:DUF4864 domain-containing protein n=1 Tax=Limnoraphis robusta CCNP1315 TaxID=3110306 RepID=A0ABU5U7D4_9CYAN|nr:DUF4864 domain-containing protein [Limnoraphis robusta]MEA5500876.1 DUF4864 domain-containing protein [Limnoraphis robusta BA-68 BA1]MEA5523112.1 DUF4864 domain-containing protein [Limnoraphis robusta CCNP1315]MEA5537877.1 DUF4864 domain-containing protein [Limnoraphis robusta Tam1]MEA5548100.1 DUF4864 domain-containing protein [Limnoraphis robusta CCNP1324]